MSPRPPARLPRLACWLCLPLLGMPPAVAGEGGPARRSLRAQAVEEGPAIDGRLDDEAWSLAEPSSDFVQVDPREGAAPTEATTIRALYDAEKLYLAIRCEDSEPDAILASQMKRDGNLAPDDRVQVVLDTFADRQNGYSFTMNPAGAKVDALIAGNGQSVNEAWDAIWEGRASIDSGGWSVEMAIPFASLSFAPELESWGFNVQRTIKRRLESDRWESPRRNVRVTQLSEAGVLSGLRGIHQGLGLDLVPFFVGRYVDEEDEQHTTGSFGFDAFYRLGPGVGAALTYHTDFAETEVDERRINLTRFPLFFPEKRDFFLQDSGVFRFADLGNDLVPFFSRRIGLGPDGSEVPIALGGRVSGRADSYNFGLLGVRTEEAAGFDAADLLVARVSKNVGEQSALGGIFTHGDPDGRDRNTLLGLDWNLGTSTFQGDQNLRSSLWALATRDGEEEQEGLAYGVSLAYPNALWNWRVAAKEIQEDFHPALGFVPRTGIRSYSASVRYQRVLNNGLRWVETEIEAEAVTDLDDRLESFVAPIEIVGLVWDAGDELHLQAVPAIERLDESFEIFEGVVVEEGDYDWWRWRIESESALKRPVSVFGAVEDGGFFDGDRTDYEAGLSWRPSRYFQGALAYTQSHVDLSGGSFVTHLGSLRFQANVSPDLTWSNFLQFDNESDSLGWNSRLLAILAPGRELALVLNESVERREGALVSTSDQVAIKLQYTLRF